MRNSIMDLVVFLVATALAMRGSPASAITITVDYRYDTNHFFDTNPGTTLNPDGAIGAQQARKLLLIGRQEPSRQQSADAGANDGNFHLFFPLGGSA
jgi:hypothetical protein